MARKTTLARLEEVEAAITAVTLNQSYSIDGRTVTRANLQQLLELEKYLEKKYSAEQGKRPIIQTVNFTGLAYSKSEEESEKDLIE